MIKVRSFCKKSFKTNFTLVSIGWYTCKGAREGLASQISNQYY